MSQIVNSQNEFKPFTEATLDDALVPIRERFDEYACELARKHLLNPLRNPGADIGTIGYRKGKPVCFQVACLRRFYFQGKELLAIVGGLTCRTRKGCPPSVTFETIERAERPRQGSVMSFGNTCCSETASIDAAKGGCVGPVSCSQAHWGIVSLVSAAIFLIGKKFGLFLRQHDIDTLNSIDYSLCVHGVEIKRQMDFNSFFCDELMRLHLEASKGIVCSRSAKELEWIFGGRIRSGKCVMLEGWHRGIPCGYIVLAINSNRQRGHILDWFAAGNDDSVLEALLVAAMRFLKKNTWVAALEVVGFPTFVQPLIAKYLPHVVELKHNRFSWGVGSAELREKIVNVIDSPASWFFGPYDGDGCF